MKKNLIIKMLLGLCMLVSQIAMAQPPPPHPGGSGNQGAPIVYYSLIVLAALSLGANKKYYSKK